MADHLLLLEFYYIRFCVLQLCTRLCRKCFVCDVSVEYSTNYLLPVVILFSLLCMSTQTFVSIWNLSRVPPGHGKYTVSSGTLNSTIPYHTWSWKVMEFRKTIVQAWKVMKNSKGNGKLWKMMIMSWNFYYCTEQFCKSGTTSFISPIMNRFIFLTMVLRADGTVATNSGMHS